MGKSAPSPPPAPDYSALAKEQGASNVLAAQQSGMMSNPNVKGPLGSRTVTWGKQYQSPEVAAVDKSQFYKTSADVNYNDPTYQAKAWEWGRQFGSGTGNARNPLQNYAQTPEGAAALAATKGQIFDQEAYDKAMKDYNTAVQERESKALITPTIEEKLTPEAQAALEAQQRTNKALAELGERSVGRVEEVMGKPFQYTGEGIKTSFDTGRPIQYGPEAGKYGLQEGGVAGPNLQTKLEGVYQAPVNAGTTAQQAIMGRLQPQVERERSQLQTQLANQGIMPGSAAYENAMTEQNQRENDLMSQAALQGVNVDISAQNQAFNQALASGQFGNQANMGLFQSALAKQHAKNAAAAQQYNQSRGAAEFANAADQAKFNRELSLYNLPLNQVSALMSGSQVQIPQYQAFQASNVQATPIFQAGQAQNQYNMDVYNAGVQEANAQNAMWGNILGSGMMAYGMKK